jgi:RND family efflux transporter MFP subunit
MTRWYAFALGALLLTAPACNQVQSLVGSPPAATAAPQAARAVTVSVQPVRQGPISLILTYSGTIQPTQQLSIAPRTAGRIEKVFVDVGSVVKSGDKLATLDRTLLESSVRQAEAGVAVAQAKVDTVKGGPRAEDVTQAEASLASAKAKLQQVKNGPTASDLQAANAAIASSELALQRSQADLLKLQQSPTADDLRSAQFNIDKAKNALFAAQTTRDGVCGNSRNAQFQCDSSNATVAAAQTAVDSAQRDYEKVKSGPSPVDIAIAQTAVQNSQESLQSSRAKLAQLRSQPSAEDIAIAQSAVTTAESQLAAKKTPYTASDLQTAQAQLAQAQATLDSAKAQLAEVNMLAPFDGVILAKLLGDGALTSTAAPILTLASPQIELAITVEEARIGMVQPGQKVALTVPAYPGQPFQAKIASIAPSADSKTHTFVVKVTPDNSDGRLRPGMFAEVKITADEQANALLVTKDAIVDRAGKSVVFVVADGKASMRELRLGLSDDVQVQAVSGVSAGDMIAIAGQAALNDGDSVRIAAGAQPAGGQQPGQPAAKPQGATTPGAQPSGAGTPGPSRQKPDGSAPAQTPAAAPSKSAQ